VTGCERSKYRGALQASDFPSGYVAVHSFFRGYQTAGPAQHLRRDFQRLPECSAFASDCSSVDPCGAASTIS
jgi:hypothetical protein